MCQKARIDTKKHPDMNANTDDRTFKSLSPIWPVLPQFRGKIIKFVRVLTVVLTALAAAVTCPETLGQATVYTVLELSPGVPRRLNNLGDAAGRAVDSASGETRAAIWNHGQLKKFAMLFGGEYGSSSAINDAGEVAGEANTVDSIVPFFRAPKGPLKRIPLLPGDNCGQAFGINKHGHVVGYSSGPMGRRAFLWTKNAGVRNLGTLPGGNYSSASDINDLDEVAGTSGSAAGERAVLWTTNGIIRDLGTLPGDMSSQASAINNNGEVVGYSKGLRGMRAFLWTQLSGMQDLGVLAGGNSSRALGVNDAGEVVGSSTSSLGDRAFIWTRNGSMQDLNNLASLPLGAVLLEAHAINSQGQIVVMGGTTDEHCAPAPPASFLLTPSH
jgi:probable HAF family extracellular repeat protein